MTYEEWNAPEPEIRPDTFWQNVLNEAQWEAVRHCDGPLLVVAGAGSGKTRVLTYKIAYLLEHGWQPWEILALTFTNKSAREMSQRIAEIVGGEKTKGLWSGTFHSIFARILRTEHESLGIKRDYTIYDVTDQRSLIKSIVKEMGLDDSVYKPAAVAYRISNAKNRLLLPEDYASQAELVRKDAANMMGELHRVYTAYWQRCRMAEALDFDDLLLYTYLLFSRDENIRKKYASRFRYILIDEYQDTNYAQYKIIELLTREQHRICVVGDDAQSIYSFRGASIENILRFNKQFPETVTVKLERNYRSTQNIVNAANSIIQHNRRQIPKKVYSENAVGDPLQIVEATDQREEAVKVCGLVKNLNRKCGVPFEEMAVLYRTNAQSRSFEDIFRQQNIPYRIYGGTSFYDRKEIRDIIAYFRLMTNLDDEEAYKRIINYPARGIGNTTLQKIIIASREHNASLWAVTENPETFALSLNRGTLAKLESFCAMILEFREMAATTEAFELACYIIERSGIQETLLKDKSEEGIDRLQNVDELKAGILNFQKDSHESRGERARLNDFLAQIALMTDSNDKDGEKEESVTLMTVHSAKGLEFDTVFVTGLEDNIFPAQKSRMNQKEEEEERRLFYVAVTRAKAHCFLTYARSRFLYGNIENSDPSMFIYEIDGRYVKSANRDYETRAKGRISSPLSRTFPSSGISSGNSPAPRISIFHTPKADIPKAAQTTAEAKKAEGQASSATVRTRFGTIGVGTRISHSRFGNGTVLKLEGTGDNAMALINFEQAGRKKLLLKFARFTIQES